VATYFIEYPLALWHTFRLSWRVWRKHGLDAIHACNPPDLLFLVGAAFKVLARSRFLFDHHDVNPELYEAKFGRRDLLWRALVVLERLSFRWADVSLATNESYRDVAIQRAGMDPSRVFVVRSGPILDNWPLQPPKPELRRGRRHLVGYSGVMGKQEGIDLLLLAIRHIVRELGRQDIHFGLVGGGTAWAALRGQCTKMGLDDYVTFTGRVPQQELLDMLNTADVCVNPDVANPMNDISTMNKIMEYMALAKPIVQFDLKEGRFSAQDASLYAARNDPVDLALKIVELIDDPQRRARMGAAGRARVEAVLDWRHEAPQLLRAYETLFAD
jgi:glycosyltransferase involved in cell wall biosynthesis